MPYCVGISLIITLFGSIVVPYRTLPLASEYHLYLRLPALAPQSLLSQACTEGKCNASVLLTYL